jgi:hypothetical protein
MIELKSSLNFCGHRVNLKIEQFREILSGKLEREFLISTLSDFFACYIDGYVCRGLECWSMFKRGKAFYIFDPLGIQVKEKKAIQRRAVLYRFESVEAMIDQVLMSMDDIFGVDSEEICQIGAILSCSTCDTRQVGKTVVKPKTRTVRNRTPRCVAVMDNPQTL